MNNIYYLVWNDSIVGFRKHNPERRDWKIALFVMNTWLNALNLWTVFIWLKLCGIEMLVVKIDIMQGTIINSFVAFCIQFVLVFIPINYFLIFYKDRYKRLADRYPNRNGRLAFFYAVGTGLTSLVSAILAYTFI